MSTCQVSIPYHHIGVYKFTHFGLRIKNTALVNEVLVVECRLVICALSSSQFAIADPADASMLDIAGFDASTPSIIQSFAAGYF